MPKISTPSRATFGLFEVDLKSGELRKDGYRIKLQTLPFKVLAALLENPGEVVTREELQLRIWGPDVIVDFDHSLSNAIKKLREALGDSADNPRFIQTLSRRGFRFVAPVGFANLQNENGTVGSSVGLADAPSVHDPLKGGTVDLAAEHAQSVRGPLRYLVPVTCFVLGVLIAGSSFQFRNARRLSAPIPRITQITRDGSVFSPEPNLGGWLSAFVTDGVHIFTPASDHGHVVLSQISIATGMRRTIPLLREIGSPEVEDISPDGNKLLVRSNLGSSVQQPLWIVTVDGRTAFRVSNVLAQDAVWMPDGKRILYTSGNQIAVASPEDGRSVVLANTSGRAFWPRWSPDGKTLRFTIIDAVNHTSSLWEISLGQSIAHPILKTWSSSVHECCGDWTADGRFFVFEANEDGNTDLWKVKASLDASPVRITNGPLNYNAPSPGRDGERIFFVGQDVHSLLERYDAVRNEYVPQPGFLAEANLIRFSGDGHWVTWIDSNHRLWRARADGTDEILLTPDSMQVYIASWSPDNTRLAFMAREPKQPWQIYMVSSDGGTPERLLRENRNIGSPSFSADGKYLAFGTTAELMGEKNRRTIEMMDLATHRVTEVVHSEGLFSPEWSPDGRYIAAITLDQKHLMLYDTTTMMWKLLASTSASYPVWSLDSKAIYIYAYKADNEPLLRVSVPNGQLITITDISNFHGNMAHAEFAGILPNLIPLMRAEISSGNLYTSDLAQK